VTDVDLLRDVRALRFALAAVWTECEKDDSDFGDCQDIAEDALRRTARHGPPWKCQGGPQGVGKEGWREYVEGYYGT
jgi:hypothetical protein